jgi:hypothetical protein
MLVIGTELRKNKFCATKIIIDDGRNKNFMTLLLAGDIINRLKARRVINE